MTFFKLAMHEKIAFIHARLLFNGISSNETVANDRYPEITYRIF